MKQTPQDRLAYRLARTLDLGELSPAQRGRLAASRRQALALAGRGTLGARARGLLRFYAAPAWRAAFSLALVLGVVLAAGQLSDRRALERSHRVDSALLVDDLPIDAYLDDGFRAWIAAGASS